MAGKRSGALACALLVLFSGLSPAHAEQPSPARQRAEVTELTTPTTQVFAEPDGTFTMETRPAPVRGRKNGSWAPIDTALRFTGNGTVETTVGAVEQAFSAGGDGPLVRVAEGTNQVELTWPHRLPQPELAGDTAIYREVLPGVDLKLRALRTGYAKVLVVKDRAAALNPELRKLSFGMRTKGVTVQPQQDGTAAAVDGVGNQVFRTGKAVMWDATRKITPVPMGVGTDELSLVPDQALLTGPDTQYPVEIDPDWGVGKSAWALVYGIPDRYRGQSYWWGDGDGVAKVGYSQWEDPVVQARSYFQFDVSGLFGKHILSAEFNALETYAPSCSAREVGLHETGAITPGTTWNAQPWIGQQLGRVNTANGWGPNCPAKWLGFNVIGAVGNSVNTRTPTTTLMLKAVDEGDTYAWKKFDPNPSLVVRYNSIPGAPLYKTTDGKDCTVVPSQAYTAKTGPALRARPSDPDGGSVQVKFEWYLKNGAKRGETTTLPQTQNTDFGITLATDTFKNGETMSWRAQTFDGTDWSPWSNWCDATIDTSRPVQPTVSSSDYPENGVGGGVGQTGKFQLRSTGGDVVAYEYDLHDHPKRRVNANADGTAEVLITPPDDRWTDFYARAIDRAGNPSDLRRYHFRAGAGTPPASQWRMDNFPMATTAPDGTAKGNDATLTPAKAGTQVGRWTVGRHGDALQLDGNGWLSTNGPAVRTDNTFTVAAWVRTDALDTTYWRTAVSQEGSVMSAFFLQLSPKDNKWRFMMPLADQDGARPSIASDVPAVVGRWTHLAGVFDKSTTTMSLYVDGVKQQQTAQNPTPWNATGPVQIGRALAARNKVDFFRGAVDDVRIYDRMLSEQELHDLAGVPTVDEGFWQLDEKSGTAAADVSGNKRQGRLTGGASWSDISVAGGGAVHLDGQTGQVETGVHAVRTDSSFTVAAHVRLLDANGSWQTAVSQDATRGSGWALRYRPDTKAWSFGVSPQDADQPAYIAANSPGLAQVGEWVQLTGVHDQAAREVRLYVNSVPVATTPIPAGTVLPELPGNLVIGRGKLNGAPGRFWGGEVDQVRVFTGVRTEDQIADDARDPRPPAPTLYKGQFSRWVTHNWEHTTSNGVMPRGYHFEAPLGFPAPADAPNTRMLYSCVSGSDEFTSTDPACEGKPVLGELGRVYTEIPADTPVFSMYRCAIKGSNELFVSQHADCEGQQVQSLLGYSVNRKYLTRYRDADTGDLRSTAHTVSGSYGPESSLGIVADKLAPSGTHGLMSCRSGKDYFLSAQGDCEGKQVVEWIGVAWDAPTDAATVELLRCKAIGSNEVFESVDPGCEGGVRDRSLGYVMPNLEGKRR
nr:LamG-like jellyroll fold domain-containing protein [Kibdelosporangium sp. MJ126-NF4]CEL19549.1 serine/threonine protein kinase [Kibdelosporangium sp. MJ126-NF4]CTQ94651.1 serine/threonine protein kinase [Kibdelosporangium sp. MJ126-NF4]